MRITLARLALFSLLFFLSSCIYDTDEIYNTPLNTVKDPTIEIINLSLTSKTVVLSGSKNIDFNFKSVTHKIIAVELVVDNIQRAIVPTFRGRFTINSSDFYRGQHTLSINVYAKTGSGCIADQLDLENFVFSYPFILIN